MSNGSKSSGTVVIQNTYLLPGGGTVSGGTQTKTREVTSWSFATRALKPNPLDDTAGVITRSYQNTGRYGSSTRRGTPDFVFSAFPAVVKNETSENELNSRRLRAGAKLGAGPLNLGVAAAESVQTANMIVNRLNSLAVAARALRNGNLSRFQEALRHELSRANKAKLNSIKDGSQRLASGWLEATLGWRPFINDIYGGMEAYRNGLTTRGAKIRASSGSNGVGYNSGSGRRSLNGDGAINYVGVPLASRAVYRGVVLNPGLRTLQEYGLINPLGILYEKLPLSFVIDWVFPLGDLFRTMTAGAGLGSIRGSQIFERRSTAVQAGVNVTSTQRIERQPISLSPFVLPNYNVDLSVSQIVTASALLRQRLR